MKGVDPIFTLKNSVVSACVVSLLAVGLWTAMRLGNVDNASAAGSPTPGVGVLGLGGSLPNVGNPGAFSLAIGDISAAGTLAGLPGRSLAYFAGVDVNTQWSTGVPYSQASANGWLLTSSSGSLLRNSGYPDNYVGDVGSSGYQQAWISNVLGFLGAHPGIDGVFVDDVLADLVPLAGTEAAKYPTQQQWAAAMVSFVTAVGNALHAKGYYVLLNASGFIPGDPASNSGAATVNWWKQLGPHVDGLMNEYYQQVPNGSNTLRTTGSSWTQGWDSWQQLVETAQSMGKDFVGIAYGSSSDTRIMSYGKASFLLDWNGGGGAYIYNDGGGDPSNAAWTTDIGKPLAAKQHVGVGWMRAYSGGVALVNPDPSTPQTFNLGGSYTTTAGQTLTQITLQPTTGAILTAVNPVDPPATSTAAAPSTSADPPTTGGSTPPPPVSTTSSTPAPSTQSTTPSTTQSTTSSATPSVPSTSTPSTTQSTTQSVPSTSTQSTTPSVPSTSTQSTSSITQSTSSTTQSTPSSTPVVTTTTTTAAPAADPPAAPTTTTVDDPAPALGEPSSETPTGPPAWGARANGHWKHAQSSAALSGHSDSTPAAS